VYVEIYTNYDQQVEAFVRQKPNATLEHLPAWSRMIERTFGHKPFYLVAHEGSSICGVLPLMQVRSAIFGNWMTSQAFSNYGGPLVEDCDALDALYDHAIKLACQHNCRTIEFRNVKPLEYDLHLLKNKVCMQLPLIPDPDKMFHTFRPEIRNRIRKAKKSRLVVMNGGLELLREFYQVWTIRMRQLGTPCYSQRLFENIIKTFSRESRIFLVKIDELTIGGAFIYCFNGLAQCRWAATNIEYNKLSPNSLVYWSAIEHYCLSGARSFDFGRSSVDSSQYVFKQRWGAKPVQLYYQYWTHPDLEPLMITQNNPKYKNRIEAWKKLPLWVTRLAGPLISRALP
jgi:FemAB-related protein (PEP-CTERM system-associated)